MNFPGGEVGESTSATWLCAFANLLVVGYALDAGLSLVEELLRVGSGSSVLFELRNGVASLVMAAALLTLPLLWLSPRLPLGLFLGLIISLIWLNTGAAPLPIAIESQAASMMIGTILQVAFALAALVWIRAKNGGQGWLFGPGAFIGPVFSFAHSLRMTVAGMLLVPPLGVVYGGLIVATELEVVTSGFVSFDLKGVSLADRRYAQGDREVRLVGMMHIGEPAAYREIVQSFIEEQAIVLEEGVSDENGVLEDGLSYGAPATALGLAQQDDLRSYLVDADGELPEWPVLRNADVDLSDLSSETGEWIKRIAAVSSGEDSLAALVEILDREISDQEIARFQYDILDVRNQHLLEQLEAALPDYRLVIIPWGALHLPFIEESILELGFEESHRQVRPLLSWWTVATALF